MYLIKMCAHCFVGGRLLGKGRIQEERKVSGSHDNSH